MNITGYCEFAESQQMQHANYLIIDAAQSVGKDYPHVIGHVTVIRGFGHFVGDRYSALKGLEAVVALHGGGGMGAIIDALKTGLKNGRDDRS
jgi:hypothetical protein